MRSGLCTVDEGRLKPLDDLLHVLVEGVLGAVVVDEVFQHVARELVYARIECMGLVDDFAFEDLFEVGIHHSRIPPYGAS